MATQETPNHLKHVSWRNEPMCVAHCDLNPSNIFVDDHRITIIDWGWAGLYNKLFDFYGILTLQQTRFDSFAMFGDALYDRLIEDEPVQSKEKLEQSIAAVARAASC